MCECARASNSIKQQTNKHGINSQIQFVVANTLAAGAVTQFEWNLILQCLRFCVYALTSA